MKKLVSLILIFMIMVTMSITVFADDVLGDVFDDDTTTITGNEYEDAQKDPVENKNNTTLPQTGSQDYMVATLFVVFAAGAIFAYKKVRDYRDI